MEKVIEKVDKQIELDGIIIPFCEEGGEHWYPVKYIVEQFLLKGYNKVSIIDKCEEFVKRKIIDYSFKGTTPQETNCMNKDGWIKYLSECKLNKNKDNNKIKRHNILCDYFGCDNKYINETENPIYDDYINDCINEITNYKTNIKFKTCTKCGRALPMHKNFFPKDDRVSGGVLNICKMCNVPNNCNYFCNDVQAREIYNMFGNQGYILYKNDLLNFYVIYIHNQNEFKLHIGNMEETKIFILKLLDYYYKNGFLKVEDINRDYIFNNFRVDMKKSYINISKTNEICSNNDCIVRPYNYPNYDLGVVDFETGRKIVNTYIQDNNIHIDNIFDYNYSDLVHKCRLTQFQKNILDFVVKYYDYQYAGYKFKIASVNYYKDKENMIFDMKYYIEKDIKIPIEKIPLYVTKWALHQNASPLYNALYKKINYNTLFEWINDCYHNKFIELDFDMNPYRSNFDSLEEAQVDEQIRSKLGNIIHNERNKPDTMCINGMICDWIACLDSGLYLIEYWGMYTKADISKSTGVQYYMNKMKGKYVKYGELMKVGYKHLYIYPFDLRNNFEGLHKKLDAINKI